MIRKFSMNNEMERKDGITAAIAAAKRGDLVVLPTDTVYGLGTDAFSQKGPQKLIAAKGRDRNMPIPVLVGHVKALDGLAQRVDGVTKALAEAFWPGALTIVVKAQPTLRWDLGETNQTVALRMPLNPIAIELLNAVGPMAVSSANKTGQPAATNVDEAIAQLGEDVTIYLDGGQTPGNVASTIVDVSSGEIKLLRQGAIPLEEIRLIVPNIEVLP
jgi:tRNA threonylcarbamoyl adenosine modification protein (Sua5/YciO/YrdC/YwlC family)